MLKPKSYAVCLLNATGPQAGVVYARSRSSADQQVRQMYGPTYVAVPSESATPKAQVIPGALSAGQKAAITKQFRQLAGV